MIKHEDRRVMVVEVKNIKEDGNEFCYTIHIKLDKSMPNELLVDVFSSILDTWRALLDEKKIKAIDIEAFNSVAEMVRTYQN